MINTQFNARTPLNQEPQRGPNFCPYCDFWHPVGSILGDHVTREHAAQLPRGERPARTAEQVGHDAAARAEKIANIKARKAARDAAEGKAS